MAAINVDETCSALPISPQDRRATSLLTDRDVNKILERKLGSGNFRLVDWRLENLGAGGFLGQYYRLHVTARCAADGDRTRNLRFFAKTPPPSDSPQFEFLTRYDSFNKEIAVYTDLMQRMGAGGSPKWMVKCYLAKQNVIIVLEDASLDGYVTPDKYVPLDEEHCVWLLKTLSKFHSRSLILDERLHREGGEDRTILHLYGHLLNEVLFVDGDDRSERILSSSITGFCAMVDLVEDLDDDAKDDVKRRIAAWSRKIARLLAPSKRHINVICHRDVWVNNMMFRHDSAGTTNGCYLIDWQFLRYCPPAIDFTCCVYLTTDRAIRDHRFDTFAKIYHDSLAQHLAQEDLDIDNHLPWTAFRESYTEARNVALVYAALNLQIMLLSESISMRYLGEADELEQMFYGDKRAKIVRHQCETIHAYKMRNLEIVREIKDRLPEHPPNP